MDIIALAKHAYYVYQTTLQAEGKQVMPWNGLSGLEQLAWMNATQEMINANLWEKSA